MKLNSKNLRLGLIGGIAVLSLAFFVIAIAGLKVLGHESDSLVQLKVKSQKTQELLVNLEFAKKEVQKYAYFKDVAKTVIPDDKDQAEAVVELYKIANQSGIALQSIIFPASTLGKGGSAVASPQSATGAGATASALTQAKPVAGISGLYSLELTITPQSNIQQVPPDKLVTFAKMQDFLRRIENNRRTAQITEVDIQPAGAGQSFSFVMKINIFIKP